MLIACPSCRSQYDAGSHPAGSIVRCLCGKPITVPEQKARDLRMLHCSSCGASLKSGCTDCDYCGASVGLGEKGLGDVCPECTTRLVTDASFCSGCGVGIEPRAMMKALSDLACPRCGDQLAECVAPGTQLIECTSCAGLWLDEETFERLTHEREGKAPKAVPGAVSKAARRALTPDVGDVSYLGCPVCGERMHRRNFAKRSGVIIDWCRGHGFWFDADELERIMRFVDEGGLQRSRRWESDERDRAERKAELAWAEQTMARHVATDRPGRFGDRGRSGDFDLLDGIVGAIRWLLR